MGVVRGRRKSLEIPIVALLGLLVGMLDQPVESDVDFHVVLGRDGVEADFAALDGIQITVGKKRTMIKLEKRRIADGRV